MRIGTNLKDSIEFNANKTVINDKNGIDQQNMKQDLNMTVPLNSEQIKQGRIGNNDFDISPSISNKVRDNSVNYNTIQHSNDVTK